MAEREPYLVDITEAATVDMEGITSFVAGRSPAAAIRMVGRLKRAALSLEKLPRRGRIVPELARFDVTDLREIIISPYRMIYRFEGRRVRILTVFDSRRDLDWVLLRMMLGQR